MLFSLFCFVGFFFFCYFYKRGGGEKNLAIFGVAWGGGEKKKYWTIYDSSLGMTV